MTTSVAQTVKVAPKVSRLRRTAIKLSSRHKLQVNRLIASGGFLVFVFLIVAIVGPLFSSYPPLQQDLTHTREAPSRDHWFGTDELGRDLFSRVIAGARITLKVSLATLGAASLFGLVTGLTSGYFGGYLDTVLMRLIDVQLAIPSLALALVMISVIGVGLNSLVLVMSVLAYPSFARLVRGLTLAAREEGYVEAARSIGASNTRVLLHHILPNIIPHVLSLATVTLGRVVLNTASLGFLGFGVEPGTPEWGMMIAQGRTMFRTHPHVVAFPGAAILFVVLGFNLLGDGLRDLMDPRLR